MCATWGVVHGTHARTQPGHPASSERCHAPWWRPVLARRKEEGASGPECGLSVARFTSCLACTRAHAPCKHTSACANAKCQGCSPQAHGGALGASCVQTHACPMRHASPHGSPAHVPPLVSEVREWAGGGAGGAMRTAPRHGGCAPAIGSGGMEARYKPEALKMYNRNHGLSAAASCAPTARARLLSVPHVQQRLGLLLLSLQVVARVLGQQVRLGGRGGEQRERRCEVGRRRARAAGLLPCGGRGAPPPTRPRTFLRSSTSCSMAFWSGRGTYATKRAPAAPSVSSSTPPLPSPGLEACRSASFCSHSSTAYTGAHGRLRELGTARSASPRRPTPRRHPQAPGTHEHPTRTPACASAAPPRPPRSPARHPPRP